MRWPSSGRSSVPRTPRRPQPARFGSSLRSRRGGTPSTRRTAKRTRPGRSDSSSPKGDWRGSGGDVRPPRGTRSRARRRMRYPCFNPSSGLGLAAMLRVDIRDLHRGPVETVGRLDPDDPAFAGLNLELAGPISVDGRLQETGPGEYFWRGRLRGERIASCRRCLTEVRQPIDVELSVLFSEDPDAADDPSVYPLSPHAATLDLGESVREELALAVP